LIQTEASFKYYFETLLVASDLKGCDHLPWPSILNQLFIKHAARCVIGVFAIALFLDNRTWSLGLYLADFKGLPDCKWK